MPTEKPVDLAAASRIARRVDLREIRLTDVRAVLQSDAPPRRGLTPTFEHDCVPLKTADGMIEVACSYKFTVHSAGVALAEASMTYRIVYGLIGDEPTDASDIEQFARANGSYHSWPFVRETLNGLTAKMGFTPYTLPVLSFMPRPQPPVAETTITASPEESAEEQATQTD